MPDAEREQDPADGVAGNAAVTSAPVVAAPSAEQQEADVGDDVERVRPVERRVRRRARQR